MWGRNEIRVGEPGMLKSHSCLTPEFVKSGLWHPAIKQRGRRKLDSVTSQSLSYPGAGLLPGVNESSLATPQMSGWGFRRSLSEWCVVWLLFALTLGTCSRSRWPLRWPLWKFLFASHRSGGESRQLSIIATNRQHQNEAEAIQNR